MNISQISSLRFGSWWPTIFADIFSTSGVSPVHKYDQRSTSYHDDVIKWNIIRVTDRLCGEFTGHKG